MEKRGRGRPRKKVPSELHDNVAEKKMIFVNEQVSVSDDLPEFFKIYIADLSSQTLRIPPDIVDKVGVNMSTRWTLRRKPWEASWEVETNTNNEDHWFFEKGWPEFVIGNSLRDGDFMAFCFAGNSTFTVTVFSPNGCMKGGDEDARRSGSDDEASKSGNSEIKGSRQIVCTTRSSSIWNINGKPSFVTVILKSYMKKGSLLVPMEFWIRHMREKKGEGPDSRTVRLWVKKESWSVILVKYRGRVTLQGGFLKFCRDNSIKVGKTCTFQLLDAIHWAFKVTIDHK